MSQDEKISGLKVLHSAAGYYIGRQYWDTDFEAWLPYSRESVGYWKTQGEADEALKSGKYEKRGWA